MWVDMGWVLGNFTPDADFTRAGIDSGIYITIDGRRFAHGIFTFIYLISNVLPENTQQLLKEKLDCVYIISKS